MKNKHLNRASIASILFLSQVAVVGAAIEPPGLEDKKGVLKDLETKVMNVLLETYGDTDWSQVINHVVSHPDDPGNPNVMMIPLSLGNVLLSRYEKTKDISDLELAVLHFESVARGYAFWKQRWLTPGVVHYLVVSLDRARKICPFELSKSKLPKRLRGVWQKVKTILMEETEYRLSVTLPYAPHDSCFTGDSKAEENAWEATLFAAAANFLPDDPRAAEWDEKARQLAYNAITRPSDPPDKFGIKTCTVEEDMTLWNHGFAPNPYYSAATLVLLAQGALSYRLTGRAIPREFMHNVRELQEKYSSYLSTDLSWIFPADPVGTGSLFPLWFDTQLELKAVIQKALEGYLWKPTKPVAVMGTGSDLWEAIQNSKVVFYYLMGSYFWRFPPSPCFDVQLKSVAGKEDE